MRGILWRSVAIAAFTAFGAANAQAQTADVPDSAATTARITLGTPVHNRLDAAGDKDWYRVTLDAGQVYRVALDGAGDADALADPLVRVVNARGQEVARDDDGGAGLNSYLEFTPTARGTYFVEARGFSDDATGGYELRVARGDIPNDATTDATISADGDSREGVLSPAGDSDWYRLDLTADQAVRIQLNNAESNGVGDPLLVIHGPDGAEVARDDDSGGNLNSYLEFTATTAGHYFVEARGFSDTAEGGYVLQVTSGEIGATADTSEAITPGNPRTSQINPANDTDWFSINLVEGRPYRFTLAAADGDGGLADPVLGLLDGEGHEIATDDDGGKGVSSYLSFTPKTSGTYYLAASGYNGGTGRYTLNVADTEIPSGQDTDESLDPSGDDRMSALDFTGDRDSFSVEMHEGEQYRITVEGAGDTPLKDAVLAVNTDEGITLASARHQWLRSGVALTYSAPKDGTFFLQVGSARDRVGGYRIAIERVGGGS